MLVLLLGTGGRKCRRHLRESSPFLHSSYLHALQEQRLERYLMLIQNKQTLPLQETASAAAYEAQRVKHERCAELLSLNA